MSDISERERLHLSEELSIFVMCFTRAPSNIIKKFTKPIAPNQNVRFPTITKNIIRFYNGTKQYLLTYTYSNIIIKYDSY